MFKKQRVEEDGADENVTNIGNNEVFNGMTEA